MMYLVAVFLSPLYFLIKGKWLGFIINSIFYGIAVALLLTLILSFLAPIPWLIAAVHAMMAYRKQLVEEDATVMARKMAEAMRQPPTDKR